MPTKVLKKEETMPANHLRSISQKKLLEKLNNLEKLGLIVNNNISVAMLSWEKYEDIIDLINEQDKKISKLEDIIEDMQLAIEYGEDVLKIEDGLNKSYEFDSASELFDMVKQVKG